MNKRFCFASLFFVLLLLSTTNRVAAGNSEDPLEDLWDALEDVGDTIGDVWNKIKWIFDLKPFLKWLGKIWGGFVEDPAGLIKWIWGQFYMILIDPVVKGWKGAVADVAEIFRAPLDSLKTWITTDVPRAFTDAFGSAAPVFMTITAVIIIVALGFAVKAIIPLL